MEIPVYVTAAEVMRVCALLKIRDWTALTAAEVDPEEAGIVLAELNTGDMPIELDDFRMGLEVELEHGLVDSDVNVTNNHPILTGMIVLAHLKESLDYYKRLEVAEIEGDMLKAAAAGNEAKLMAKYRLLVKAKAALAAYEMEQLSGGK